MAGSSLAFGAMLAIKLLLRNMVRMNGHVASRRHEAGRPSLSLNRAHGTALHLLLLSLHPKTKAHSCHSGHRLGAIDFPAALFLNQQEQRCLLDALGARDDGRDR